MAKKKKQKDFGAEIINAIDRWNYIYENGCNDPGWPDGVNLNLVRNHIIYYKRQIEETTAPEDYPSAYYEELPPEVPQDYMARVDEIRKGAADSLKAYLNNSDFKYLSNQKISALSKAVLKETCIINVLNYARGLENAIEKDDLVTMRRHCNANTYISAFTPCARKLRLIQFSNFKTMILRRKEREKVVC